MTQGQFAGDISPEEAWEILAANPKAQLVDVRTAAEWAFVGFPDLRPLGREVLFVSWQEFPSMQVNPRFFDDVWRLCPDREAPLLFLCRSGHRSRLAAIACAERGYQHCYNIDSGFEGVLDASHHRSRVNGWKVANLPWVQR